MAAGVHETGEPILSVTHPSSIHLAHRKRNKLAQALERQLAALQDLYSHVKQAHWNVRGPFFYARHELFDEVAGHLRGMVDDVAERIGALGFYANGTTRMAAHNTYLPPYDTAAASGQEHIQTLVRHFGRVERELRDLIPFSEALEDPITADLVTTLLGTLEKDLWFLESHLEPSPVRIAEQTNPMPEGPVQVAPIPQHATPAVS